MQYVHAKCTANKTVYALYTRNAYVYYWWRTNSQCTDTVQKNHTVNWSMMMRWSALFLNKLLFRKKYCITHIDCSRLLFAHSSIGTNCTFDDIYIIIIRKVRSNWKVLNQIDWYCKRQKRHAKFNWNNHHHTFEKIYIRIPEVNSCEWERANIICLLYAINASSLSSTSTRS